MFEAVDWPESADSIANLAPDHRRRDKRQGNGVDSKTSDARLGEELSQKLLGTSELVPIIRSQGLCRILHCNQRPRVWPSGSA
jgi:hypothetical protein